MEENNKNLWEETNSIGPLKNCENNQISDLNDTINEINRKLTEKRWKNIGKISGIYKIINKVNGKYYVGSSKDIIKRLTTHISDLNKNVHHNDFLQKSWIKYGNNFFEFSIVEILNFEKEILLKTEQKYLDLAKSEQHKCYNLNFDAYGGDISEYSKLKIKQKLTGIKRSSFTKNKISVANKGILLGCKLSEQHKLKISNAKKGKTNGRHGIQHSLETIQKMKSSHIGKKLSNEHKQKISLIKIDKTIYHFYNVKTAVHIYTTKYKLIKIFNLNRGNLIAMIKNKRKSCKGWILYK